MIKKTNAIAVVNSSMEISSKSTKEQILAAYQSTLAQLEAKQQEPAIVKQEERKATIVTKATQNSANSIVHTLFQFKTELAKQIDTISERMVTEFNKLNEIQEAVTIEQAHLKELYDINETSKTLSALLMTQQEQKEKFAQQMEDETESFEQETEQKKAQWKQQQETLSAEYKELKEQLEKARKRDEDEYKYNLDYKRKKEMDDYAIKKATLEKELAEMRLNLDEREAVIKAREIEFNELKKKVDDFQSEIIRTREETEHKTKTQLETQFNFTKELREKEVEGERKLNEQKIVALESKIKEQAQLILQLTQKADSVVNQIQSIACRALDTSAQRFGSGSSGQSYQQEEKSTGKGGEK